MIPISLIVSLEFVRIFQSFFLNRDEDMINADFKVRQNTFTINEELGQIEFIFTDKTGTLTANDMQYKYCIIGNQMYDKDLGTIQKEPWDQIYPFID
jgi:phospholipid-transporting ATPase